MFEILDLEDNYTDRELLKVDGVIFDEHGDFVPNVFNKGESLNTCKYRINAHDKSSQNGELTDKISVRINRSIPLLVVSNRVVNLLLELDAKDIEFLDVDIKLDGMEIRDYKIVNILKRIDCVDDQNSELVYYSGTNNIYAIERLRILEKNIPPEIDIFQMDRIEKNVTIVSKKLIDEINLKNLTGFRFISPKKFAIG